MFPGFWQLMIVLALILLIFGTKRLKDAGGDLGGAIKGFKKAMQDEDGQSISQEGKNESSVESTQKEKQD